MPNGLIFFCETKKMKEKNKEKKTLNLSAALPLSLRNYNTFHSEYLSTRNALSLSSARLRCEIRFFREAGISA
jgi:hypothetical protein